MLAATASVFATSTYAQPGPSLIPSPWGGSMSAAEQEASAAQRPMFADANWNHEVCVVAYSFEGVPEEIARRRAALQIMHKEGAKQADERRRIAALEQQAAEHLPNIPRCKGQFYRPALTSLCDGQARDNRFCAQLSGRALPGVELVEDRAAFVRGLAWNKVGDLFSKGVAFAPAPWAASANRPVDLVRPDLSGIAYIAATNKAVKAVDGSPIGQAFGQWAFSLEMERLPLAEEGVSLGDLSAAAAKTGMPPGIGGFVQFPQLHFQAFMFDMLLAGDWATIAVEMRDGTRHQLHDPALFQDIPRGAPAFYSSFASYRIHAVSLPSPDELRLVLDPNAAFLAASFPMRLEDGRIDTVTLRTPLDGIVEAWKAMNAANLEAHRRILRAERAAGS